MQLGEVPCSENHATVPRPPRLPCQVCRQGEDLDSSFVVAAAMIPPCSPHADSAKDQLGQVTGLPLEFRTWDHVATSVWESDS